MAGTRASVLGVLVLPVGAAPPLALVELPEGEAPPLAPVDVEPGGRLVALCVTAPGVLVEVEALEAGAVDVLSGLVALVEPVELLECEEPPHPAITRKAARSAEDAARRLTFPA